MVLAIRTVKLLIAAALLASTLASTAEAGRLKRATPEKKGNEFAIVIAAIGPCKIPQWKFNRIRKAQLIDMRLRGLTYSQVRPYELAAIQKFILVLNDPRFPSIDKVCRDIDEGDRASVRLLKAVEKLKKKLRS